MNATFTDAALRSALTEIKPPNQAVRDEAQWRQDRLTKPPGSLGLLEEIAIRLCAIQGTLHPELSKPAVWLFASDHGVCAQGINAYPQAVTGQMVKNFVAGGAAINAISRTVGATLHLVDCGILHAVPEGSVVIDRRLGPGTRDMTVEPAMTKMEALQAIWVGWNCAEEAVRGGSRLLATGEMGIGNTTSASAIAAALTGLPPEVVCGRGTASNDSLLPRKVAVVTQALTLHAAALSNPLNILANLGGFEIGALCGFCLGAAHLSCAVLVDGFIATAAAALAVQLAPAVNDYLFAGHLSSERGHAALLSTLHQQPILQLGMRLGEGTGAALAIPILNAAVGTFFQMATFESAQVSER